MNAREIVSHIAGYLHQVHGTKGLLAANAMLLLLALLEPVLAAYVVIPLVILSTLLLIIATSMLPREGVAVLARAKALSEDPDPSHWLKRRLAWLAALTLALLPAPFLVAYGVPHMTPLTGLIAGVTIQRLGVAYLILTILFAVMYVRRSRAVAPEIRTMRPMEMRAKTQPALQRQAFLVGLLVLGSAWLWLTHSFWQPHGAAFWPPSLASLGSASRVAAVAFTLTVPLLMLVALAGHFEALWRMRRHPAAIWIGLHIVLCFAVVAMHGHNLLTLGALQRAGFL